MEERGGWSEILNECTECRYRFRDEDSELNKDFSTALRGGRCTQVFNLSKVVMPLCRNTLQV